ncbi:CU044_2847 family protein [Kocuria sp. CPCC 205292]|uniref:CU044_2847 family protein n=1 Tax=Kocuria cellulosilytica TaxID=3071451 RepID=UPI0034D46595
MGDIVSFPTADGRSVLVETTARSGEPVTRGGHRGSVVQEAQRSFEEAVGHIQPAVQALIDQLVSLAHRPSGVSVEFGVDLHAEAGAFIAKTGGTANFTVKLTWEDARTE